jgi:hypothetical protein
VPVPVTVLQFLPLPSSSSPHPAPLPVLRLLFHACQERAMFSCRAALRLFPAGFPRFASQPEHTFDRVREWHPEFLELASSSTSMVSPDAVVLVGTKCDLRRPGSRHVTVSEAEAQVRHGVCVWFFIWVFEGGQWGQRTRGAAHSLRSPTGMSKLEGLRLHVIGPHTT